MSSKKTQLFTVLLTKKCHKKLPDAWFCNCYSSKDTTKSVDPCVGRALCWKSLVSGEPCVGRALCREYYGHAFLTAKNIMVTGCSHGDPERVVDTEHICTNHTHSV